MSLYRIDALSYPYHCATESKVVAVPYLALAFTGRAVSSSRVFLLSVSSLFVVTLLAPSIADRHKEQTEMTKTD